VRSKVAVPVAIAAMGIGTVAILIISVEWFSQQLDPSTLEMRWALYRERAMRLLPVAWLLPAGLVMLLLARHWREREEQ
jgi:hypothetical protein